MTTLYLKYRPQTISELDLVDVREILTKIVASGDIPHAFLFEGPRGSGKTSAARIMAKILNCTSLSKNNEPCNKCDQCISITKGTNIDVIELDAASNRGIDDVRLIRESVKLSPAKASKKVYIIDEAHMLTTEASNALLKTLEEPPMHVVFILATTNPEKLLDTIKSRTVRISFKKATSEEITKSLVSVLEKEKKEYKTEVLQLISENVDGSFRDAKKILEELLVNGFANDLDKAQNYLLNKSDFNVDDFFTDLSKKAAKDSISKINKAESEGVPVKIVYTQISHKLKALLFSSLGYIKSDANLFESDDVLSLSEIFIGYWNKYQNDIAEYLPLYLSVAKWCEKKDVGGKGNKTKNIVLSNSGENHDKENKDSDLENSARHDLNNEKNEKQRLENGSSSNGNEVSKAVSISEGNISEDIWKNILAMIRSKNASTEALLRASKPISFDGKRLSLGVYYKFHKEKLESTVHMNCLIECLENSLGKNVKVECVLTEPERNINVENGVNENVMQIVKDELNSKPEIVLAETSDDQLVKLAEEVFGN